MRCAMPHPCMSSSANVFRMSRSSVPCSRSVFSPMVPLAHLQEQLECHSCRWTTRELAAERGTALFARGKDMFAFEQCSSRISLDLEPKRLRKHLYGELMARLLGAPTRAAT